MKKYYANHISRREFKYADRDNCYLITNYATRIRNYAEVNTYTPNLEHAFRELYGTNWYEVASFKQLVSTAKVFKKFHTSNAKYRNEPLTCLGAVVMYRTEELLRGSFYEHAITKYYGAKIWKDFVDRERLISTRHRDTGLESARDHATDMLKIAMFIKKYAPKELTKLKSARNYSDILTSLWDARQEIMNAKIAEKVLPTAIREKVIRDSAVSIANSFKGVNNAEDDLKTALRWHIYTSAYRLANFEPRYRGYHAAKLAKWNKEYDAAIEFGELLKELNLNASHSYRSLKYVSRKLLVAMRKVAKMDVDIAAKQRTIIGMSIRESRHNRSRYTWVPEMNAKGEN